MKSTSGLRYQFADFTLSPSRRTLLRAGSEIPLIPRYFDLLLLLITQRNEAVHRQEILDRVWKDVVVSDGALTQAVRTLRRTLDDDSRNPSFIGTVSRHGYRFVFADVVEEDDTAPLPLSPLLEAADGGPDSDPWELLLERLLSSVAKDSETDEEEDHYGRREAAEALHLLGTAETLRRLEGREGNAAARSLLRDTRWDVPTAGTVPLLGESGGWLASYHLVRLRLRRAIRLARRRWAAAVTGGALAGLLSGIAGAILLRFGPGSQASDAVLIALGVVGLVIGGAGAAGVGAGFGGRGGPLSFLPRGGVSAAGSARGRCGRCGRAPLRTAYSRGSLRTGSLTACRRFRGIGARRGRRSRLCPRDAARGRRDGDAAWRGENPCRPVDGSLLLRRRLVAGLELLRRRLVAGLDRQLPGRHEPRLHGPLLSGLSGESRSPGPASRRGSDWPRNSHGNQRRRRSDVWLRPRSRTNAPASLSPFPRRKSALRRIHRSLTHPSHLPHFFTRLVGYLESTARRAAGREELEMRHGARESGRGFRPERGARASRGGGAPRH